MGVCFQKVDDQMVSREEIKCDRPALIWKDYIQTATGERGLQEADWYNRRLWEHRTENLIGQRAEEQEENISFSFVVRSICLETKPYFRIAFCYKF